MLLAAAISLFTTLFISLVLIRYSHVHQPTGCHPVVQEPQKFHVGQTPRIGGIPILVGIAMGLVTAWQYAIFTASSLFVWGCAIAPVFLAGISEDITKKITPRWRLLASFVSALIGALLMEARLTRLALPGIDQLLLNYIGISLLVTIIAVGGICHSLNLIDGYNGLVGGVVLMVLSALGYTCLLVGDLELLSVCVVSGAATAGFLAWNYPRGYIFAGDGGAYLLGFIVAEVSVLLVARHSQISPWFPFTLMIYPIWETVFTMYRRKMVQGQAVGLPDALHLHQMVFNRLVRWMVGKREGKSLRRRNAMTTPYLWGMGLITVIPALLFRENTLALQIICGLFVLFYGWLYRRLAHFKAPRWMVTR